MTATEFADATGRSAMSAYRSLAAWCGTSLETVVEYAERGALNELVETRELTGPVRGETALRHIERLRRDPSVTPRSPAELVGELRAQKLLWEVELAEAERRNPYRRLAELYANVPPWAAD
jgi:hypothetical protein